MGSRGRTIQASRRARGNLSATATKGSCVSTPASASRVQFGAMLSKQLLSSTPKQRRALLVMAVILCCLVFRPGLEFLLRLPVRTGSVQNGNIQAKVPPYWEAYTKGESIAAARPCLSIFCQIPDSSMVVEFGRHLVGHREAWLERTESQLRSRGASEIKVQSFGYGGKVMSCIAASRFPDDRHVEIGCLRDTDGLVASYVGSTQGVSDFYSFLESAEKSGTSPKVRF